MECKVTIETTRVRPRRGNLLVAAGPEPGAVRSLAQACGVDWTPAGATVQDDLAAHGSDDGNATRVVRSGTAEERRAGSP